MSKKFDVSSNRKQIEDGETIVTNYMQAVYADNESEAIGIHLKSCDIEGNFKGLILATVPNVLNVDKSFSNI